MRELTVSRRPIKLLVPLFISGLVAIVICTTALLARHITNLATAGTGDKVASFRLSGVNTITWIPNGHQLVVGSTGGVWLYDADTPHVAAQRLPGSTGAVRSLASSRDGVWLAAGLESGDILLWSLADDDQPRVLADHTLPVLHLVFSSDGTMLASGGGVTPSYVMCTPGDFRDTGVRVWDVVTGALIWHLEGLGEVRALAFNSDSAVVMAGTSEHCAGRDFHQGSILRWNAETGEALNRLAVRTPIAFAIDGRAAAAQTSGWDTPISMQVLDMDTGAQQWMADSALPGYPGGLALSSTGGFVIAAEVWDYGGLGHSMGVQVWNAGARAEMTLAASGPVALDPSGRLIATGNGPMNTRVRSTVPVDTLVRLWDTGRGRQLALLDGHDGRVRHIAFSSDGALLASGSAPLSDGEGNVIRIWSVEP
jgi:WD40 repeat protein